jgi:hypothetical protein
LELILICPLVDVVVGSARKSNDSVIVEPDPVNTAPDVPPVRVTVDPVADPLFPLIVTIPLATLLVIVIVFAVGVIVIPVPPTISTVPS